MIEVVTLGIDAGQSGSSKPFETLGQGGLCRVAHDAAWREHHSSSRRISSRKDVIMLTVWNAFDDLFNDDFWGRPLPRRRGFAPSVDIGEDEKYFLVSADLPGIKPEDLDIHVENNVLTIRGERKYEQKGEKQGYYRVERHYGAFQRSFMLPEGVDQDAIEANLEHGTLTLRVPKPVASLPKKVKVSVGGLGEKAKKLFGKKTEETAAPPAS